MGLVHVSENSRIVLCVGLCVLFNHTCVILCQDRGVRGTADRVVQDRWCLAQGKGQAVCSWACSVILQLCHGCTHAGKVPYMRVHYVCQCVRVTEQA